MVNLGVMVLELDSSFGGCFSLELGGMEEWTSCGVVSMEDVIGGFFLGEGAVVGDVSSVKLQRFMSSISSLALTSKISSITFLILEGS